MSKERKIKYLWRLAGAMLFVLVTGGVWLCVSWYCTIRSDRDLDNRLIHYFRQSDGKAYQWKAKEVAYDYNQVRRAILVPRTEEGSKEELRKNFQKLEREIKMGEDWGESVRSFILPAATSLPTIDGEFDEDVWRHALRLYGQYPLNTAEKQETADNWLVFYTPQYFCFAAEFRDDFIDQRQNVPLYEGDALELFIMPEERYHTYVELVFAPDGKCYTQWVSQTQRSRYELTEYHPKTLKMAAKKFPGGYRIEGMIGFADLPGYLLGNPAKSGEKLRMMMLRMDRQKDGTQTVGVPVPFLYDGHNYFGYMNLTLQ